MLQSQEMPLLPYLDYYIDESLSLDIEEAAEPSRANAFHPLVLENLPREEGITWLRFTIGPLPMGAKAATFLLDMGSGIPGEPVLYDPIVNELSGAREWRENTPAQRNILLLPEATQEPIVCYIRLDGLPGPWFAPMIRTPQNAAGNWISLSRTGAMLALGVVMLLCLLRGMSENGQWRIWTALYVAISLLQALLGMPSVKANMSFGSLAAILAPGLALMLLPHVGRHLMRTPENSRALDIQLLLLSLPGCVLALLPLVPGWAWLDRWLDLWPVATILFVPTALGAWIGGLGGAKRFLIGCLIPPIFVCVAYFGLDFGLQPNFLASLPLWGVAISALLIAATRSPADMQSSKTDKTGKEDKKLKKTKPPLVITPPKAEEVINLGHPLDDPNLRIVENPVGEVEAGLPEPSGFAGDPTAGKMADEGAPRRGCAALEEALRVPLDQILREGAALGQCSLPPAVRQYAEKMIEAGNSMAAILSGNSPAGLANPSTAPQDSASKAVFNLQRVLRAVNDFASPMAEQNGISISWYMPPHLRQSYNGNGKAIEAVLKMLVESSVRATEHGAVHLSVRRVPESSDPGHILFIIQDNGAGGPPVERSSLALARAWELSTANGGYLAMESGREGTNITFSMRLPVADDEDGDIPDTAPHVVVASEDAAMRHELAKIVSAAPCRVSEAANMHEVLVCQSLDPARLLIAQGKLALPSAADMAHKFAALATQAGYTHCSILAITKDNSQWNLLKPSGFTHAMIEPVEEDALRQTVTDLISSQDGNAEAQEIGAFADVSLADEPGMEADDIGNSSGACAFDDDMRDVPDIFDDKPSGVPLGRPVATAQNSSVSQEDIRNDNFEGPDWLEVQRPADEEADEKPDIGELQDTSAKGTGISNEPNPANSDNGGTQEASMPLTDFIVGVSDNSGGEVEEVHQDGSEVETLPGRASEADEAIARDSANAQDDGGIEPARETDDFAGIDPVFRALLEKIEVSMANARKGFNGRNSAQVAQATAELAQEANGFGLRILARMATCVAQAAKENDFAALNDLLPELEAAVERNRIAFTHKSQP